MMNIENNPLVSIVLAAYNVEQYIDECIQSILRQEYENLDVIIVDDGSTDLTGVVSDNWALRDSRIRVIHQENVGQAGARNAGIRVAKGAYLMFVDPDDVVDSQLLSICMSAIRTDGADLVHYGYVTIDENNHIIGEYPDSCDCDSLLESVLSNKIQSHPWQFVCKASLYSDIKFPIGRKAEDLATVYKLVATARRIVVLPNCLYKYRIRQDSTLGVLSHDSKKAVNYYKDEVLAFNEMINYCHMKHSVQFESLAINSFCRHLFHHYRQSISTKNDIERNLVVKQLKEIVIPRYKAYLDAGNRLKAILFSSGMLYIYSKNIYIAKQLLSRVNNR